jgi:tetratricopeptide (TPR) repeat protein
MSRIFLSHSSKDNFEAIALRDFLVAEGFEDIFLDLDPDRGIAAGERWERALHAAAKRCEAVIFLITGNWLGSGWCLKEYSLARQLNKKLFAVIVDPQKSLADLPPELAGTWQAVNLVGGQDGRIFSARLPGSVEEKHITLSIDGLRRLKNGLEKAGLDPKFFAWPPENDPHRAPFRGLKPLESVDAGIFFGRDAPIIEALDRLRGLREGAAPRLLAILGASGAGKSSFLRAGLLPRLTRDDANFITVPPIRPERAALTGETGLLGALQQLFPTRSRAELRTSILAGALGVQSLFAELVKSTFARTLADSQAAKRPLIVISVDQAEELFRSEGLEESIALLMLLRDLAMAETPAVAVLFAIRSDSYDELERAKPLEGMPQNTLPLLPMPRGAYVEVIEGPIRRYVAAGAQLTIEPRLTQALLEDLEQGGGSDALPLLAFTLEQLFLEYGAAGALRYDDYRAFGGLRGAIDKAVERAFTRADADPRIPRDQKSREALLRRALIPWLAGVDPDSKNPRRNVARIADIPAEARPLVDLLVEERLLSTDTKRVKDPETGEETQIITIEPTHEALLRQWGLLEGWLAEDLGRLATLEGAKRGARDWDANGRVDAWLAHRGQRLSEAIALINDRPDLAARFDPIDKAYLANCHAKEMADRAREEAYRREREEEQARRLADAEQLAAANKRTAQRTGIGLIVALVLFALAGWQGFVATQQKQRAQQDLNATKQAINGLIFNIAEKLGDVTGIPLSTIREILGTAKSTIDAIAANEPGDKELQRSRWAMLVDFVDTYLKAGDLQDAKAAATQALPIAVALAKDKSNGQAQRDLSVSYNKVGDVSESEGNFVAALKSFQAAQAVMEQLAKAQPTILAWQRDLSVSYNRVGDVLTVQGNLGEALRTYQSGLAIMQRLVTANPNYIIWQIDLGVSNERIGDILLAQGKLDAGLKSYQVKRDIIAKLAKLNPGNATLQRDLSVAYDKIGDVQRAQGHLSDALQSYQTALSIRNSLVTSDASNTVWQRDLAVSDIKIGDIFVGQGHPADALKSYQASLAIRERLARFGPSNAGWQFDLGISNERIGDIQMAQNNFAAALKSYEAKRDIVARLANSDPANASWQRDLAVGDEKVGDALRAQGHVAEALQAFQGALDIRTHLTTVDPGNATWQRDLEIADNKVGDMIVAQNHPVDALKYYEASLVIARQLAGDKTNAQVQTDLVVSLTKVSGLIADPAPLYNEALAILEDLGRQDRLTKQQQGWIDWVKGKLAALPPKPH